MINFSELTRSEIAAMEDLRINPSDFIDSHSIRREIEIRREKVHYD